MPGKFWKPSEEQLLRRLWESGVHDFKLLTQKIARSEGAIKEKLRRMGLLVVVQKLQKKHTTTSVPLGKGLLTHEEALKVLAGALEALRNIILATHRYKNRKSNVEKICNIRGPFLKRSLNLPSLYAHLMETLYHRLTAVILCMLECCLWRGVDIF